MKGRRSRPKRMQRLQPVSTAPDGELIDRGPRSSSRRARCVPITRGRASESDERADPFSRLIEETRGLFEKLAGTESANKALSILGAKQVVLWQPRWLYAERDGLCYQKVNQAGIPLSVWPPKRIAFADVTSIDELETDGEFALWTRKRCFVFNAGPQQVRAQAMVSRLRELCERWLLGSETSLIKNLDTGVAVPLVSFVGVRSPVELLHRTSRSSSLLSSALAQPNVARGKSVAASIDAERQATLVQAPLDASPCCVEDGGSEGDNEGESLPTCVHAELKLDLDDGVYDGEESADESADEPDGRPRATRTVGVELRCKSLG